MLEIRTDIPHGNATMASVEEEDGALALRFTASPHGGTESLWWCFRIVNQGETPGLPLRIVWEHLYNCLGLNDQSAPLLHPVLRTSRADWQRLPAGQTLTRPDGRTAAAWEIAVPEKWAEVAFCFPHGPADVQRLVADSGEMLRADVIGASSSGNPLVRVCNSYGTEDDGAKRPGVYVLSHQHASEMSGAWTLDGFLRRMAERDDAPLVWSVPVTNIDGLLAGDYGKDPFPWDLNRAWGYPPMRVEVGTIMRDMQHWRSRTRPALCLDFHSPGGCENNGVYAFLPTDVARADEEAVVATEVQEWGDRFKTSLSELASERFGRIARYASRFVTPQHSNFARFCRKEFSVPVLSFETPYNRIGERVLEIADFREIGMRIADAVCEHLCTSAERVDSTRA